MSVVTGMRWAPAAVNRPMLPDSRASMASAPPACSRRMWGAWGTPVHGSGPRGRLVCLKDLDGIGIFLDRCPCEQAGRAAPDDDDTPQVVARGFANDGLLPTRARCARMFRTAGEGGRFCGRRGAWSPIVRIRLHPCPRHRVGVPLPDHRRPLRRGDAEYLLGAAPAHFQAPRVSSRPPLSGAAATAPDSRPAPARGSRSCHRCSVREGAGRGRVSAAPTRWKRRSNSSPRRTRCSSSP